MKGYIKLNRESIAILFQDGILKISHGLPKNSKCISWNYEKEHDVFIIMFEFSPFEYFEEGKQTLELLPTFTRVD